MIKRTILLTVTCLFSFVLFAQEEKEKVSGDQPERKKGFKKENLFTGGTLNVGFGNNVTELGI